MSAGHGGGSDPPGPRGPAVARWLGRILLPDPQREFILGDLEELHAVRVRSAGRGPARLRYWRDLAGSVWACFVGRFSRAGEGEESGGSGAGPASGASLGRGGPRGSVSWGGLSSDLAAAVRSLWRHPGFTVLTVVTLALGVGAASLVFGMANQLLLRPLPGVQDPDGAAYVQFRSLEDPESIQGEGISLPDLDALRREATTIEGMASYGFVGVQVATAPDRRPLAPVASHVYGDFFEILRVPAATGRLFGAAETAIGAEARVVVLTPELEQSLFGPGGSAVGRTLYVNGEAATVIGTVGGGFRGPERGDRTDLWLPHGALATLLGFSRERLTSRQVVGHDDLIVRPRAGVGMAAAEAEIRQIHRRLQELDNESAEWLAKQRAVLFPGLHVPPMWRDATYESMTLMAAVVGLVLLIACANVANLLLFRNLSRRGMLATRRALGASSGRLARQHLVSNLMLAGLGSALGLGVAWLLSLPFRGERLLRMPAFEGFGVDHRVLLFAAGAAVITALLFGALPAVLAGRFDLGAALRAAGGKETGRMALLRRGMSAGQIALCLTLLVGGMLLVRTVRNLYTMETGLRSEGVAYAYLNQPDWAEGAALEALQRDLLAAVERHPRVEHAALDLYPPHSSRMIGRAAVPGVPWEDAEGAAMMPVSAEWFELFEVEMVSGTAPRADEWSRSAPGRAVITASLARRLFGRTDVAGRTIQAGFGSPEPLTVAAVTRELRWANSPEEPYDGFFVPFGVAPLPGMTLVVRADRLDAGVLGEVREVIESVLPAQPVPDLVTLAERIDGVHSERRVFGNLLGLLSALALLLAAVGLYGVIAFAVAGRTREFGIRLALGARTARIARLVLGDAGAIVGWGAAAGLLGAYVLSSVLESRLFGVERVDPASYAGALALLAGVAVLACWRPARTATRVDPVKTLREE